MAVEIEISEKMVEEVMDDFERENPGKTHMAMSSSEFADRMMKKIMASARELPEGNA